jgi:ribosomal protein L31E
MAKKEIEPKIILEREYIVPLRRGWLKVPMYKRANKAVKTLKEFMVQHMKVYDRDLRKIKVDIILNNELRFRGMKKPLNKVRVMAKKFDNGIVKVELIEIPKQIKFARLREEKKLAELSKKAKVEEKKEEPEKKEEKREETQDAKEKKESSKEESLMQEKHQGKEMKHIAKDKNIHIQRKALQK